MGNCISISLPCKATDDVISHCYACIAQRASYLCKLEENLEALMDALQDLIDAKNSLIRRVTLAEQQQLRRLDEVQTWITRVETKETEVNEQILQRRTEEISRLCLWGCCSTNYRSSYKFGQKVSRKLAEVTDLRRRGIFEVVAESEPIAPVVEIPVEATVGMESLFDEVWRGLSDENVRIIGLYGMGGVGKTTLLKKINNNFPNTPNNYYVIWIVISKDHTLEKIQNDIGEKIGYSDDTWRNRNYQQKAEDICKVFSKKKFVLLLDDIWERIDLVKVGVPFPNNQNGSKLVFTTRSKDVCCRMNPDKQVEVKCLSWEKSWKLFREKVGEGLNVHPDVPELAEVVAKECSGLPLALITIGRAMACKRTPQEWRYAIHVLKNSASEFSGMGDEVFPLLKFSYDNLSNEKVKSCFLYCALFPEDWEIEKDDLINYWMCEGFLDEYIDINGLQGQGYNIIGSLLYACLLEESNTGTSSVKMHDVIRDMALWIACGCGKEGNRFLVKTNAQLEQLPKVEKWDEAERISLMRNCIQSVSGSPACPNLLTLFLHGNSLSKISNSFFQFMPKLTVLDLSHNIFLAYLPVGISNLVSLQYLNLANTRIKELPREMKNLIMLKYLNLGHLRLLDIIPEEVISSFCQLQVLNLYRCGMSKDTVEDSVRCGGNELIVKELLCLKHIIILGVSINCVAALERFFTSQMLLNSTHNLCLQNLSTMQFLNLSSLLNMEHLDLLTIDSCTSLEELKIDLDWERRDQHSQVTSPLECSRFPSKELFLSLRYVSIESCSKLKDLTGLIFAPNLLGLSIVSCIAIEEIISVGNLGDAPETVKHLEPFVKLGTLELITLPKLRNIYQKPLPFQCLKLIEVERCEKLKKLPISSDVTRGPNLTIKGYRSWWNELEWDNGTTQDAFLPCFKAYIDGA